MQSNTDSTFRNEWMNRWCLFWCLGGWGVPSLPSSASVQAREREWSLI